MSELDDALLPSSEEREGLLEALRTLGNKLTHARLLRAPLVEANDTFFPDPWAGGQPSVERLARRFFVYAGDPDARVHVRVHPELVDERDDVEKPGIFAGQDPMFWYLRTEKGVHYFGAEEVGLRDAIVIVPAVARAVAHAFCMNHGVAPDKRGHWDPRIDVMAVHLGWGRLTLDAARRHYARSDGGFRASRQVTRLGAIPGPSIAYLLAAQFIARETPAPERKAILAKLQPNAAAFVREAMAEIQARDEPLAQTLGLPPKERWPPEPDLDELTEPFDDASDASLAAERAERRDEDRGARDTNLGKPVFRVERTMATRLFRVGMMSIFMLGGLAGTNAAGLDIDRATLMPVALGLGILGLLVGRFIPDSRCSEPKCSTPLKKDMRWCPTCGGEIVGSISHPKERLAAEEALEPRTYSRPPSRQGDEASGSEATP